MAEKAGRGVLVPHLRAWRNYHAKTQEELAELASVARSTIVRGEEGKRINVSTVRRLADALGVGAADLMRVKPEGRRGVPAA
jgi:transcriptional regulator with XRE-family HTH domain